MNSLKKEDLILASKQKKIHIVRGFLPNFPSWSDIENVYASDEEVMYNSFGAFQVENLELISQCYRDTLDSISKVHNGDLLFGMIIVHLFSRNNNTLDDVDFLSLRNKVNEENPTKIPNGMVIKDYGLDDASTREWAPRVHFDAQERFYVQGNGQTLWKLFDDSKILTDAVIVNPGDLAYIPTGLHHSVESIGPRHSLSLALSEDLEITQS
jgi:mannose-6-phosphate isomerase-like protein (cupin superfamily)